MLYEVITRTQGRVLTVVLARAVHVQKRLLQQVAGKRVAVIGDVLTDRYIFCDASA